jgi:hypothetical protein
MALTYEKIASYTVTGAETTITFTTIPATYTDLVAVGKVFTTSTGDEPRLRVGTGSVDSGSNYYQSRMRVVGQNNVTTQHVAGNALSYWYTLGNVGGTTSNPFTFVANYFSYTNDKRKIYMIKAGFVNDGNEYESYQATGMWTGTGAIDRIQFALRDNTWSSGSIVTLYGILKA